MNVYEVPGGGLISVCFSSLSYHLNVTSSRSVACHILISIQCHCMLVTLSPLDVPNDGSLAVGIVSLRF